MNATRLRPLRAAALVLSLVGLTAISRASSESGSYVKNFGSSFAGGSFYAYGQIYRGSSSASVHGQAKGTVRFLGYTKEAGRVTADGYSSSYSTNGSMSVKLGGYTIWSSSFQGTHSYGCNYQQTVLSPPPVTVTVGPVPVVVSGGVGAGASLSATCYLSAYSVSAGVNGSGHAWANGWASAGIGFPGYNVSLQVDAYFGNLKLQSNCSAGVTSGLTGYAKISTTPIDLYLRAVLQAWPFQWTKTLANYYSSTYSTYLFN